MISLIPPERVGHSSKITTNGFCLIPGMHCQHYNDQHCGLILHQTFKETLRGKKKKKRKMFPARQTTTLSTTSLYKQALVCSEGTKEKQHYISSCLNLKAILLSPQAVQWIPW